MVTQPPLTSFVSFSLPPLDTPRHPRQRAPPLSPFVCLSLCLSHLSPPFYLGRYAVISQRRRLYHVESRRMHQLLDIPLFVPVATNSLLRIYHRRFFRVRRWSSREDYTTGSTYVRGVARLSREQTRGAV